MCRSRVPVREIEAEADPGMTHSAREYVKHRPPVSSTRESQRAPHHEMYTFYE